jgi:hypothetical protein
MLASGVRPAIEPPIFDVSQFCNDFAARFSTALRNRKRLTKQSDQGANDRAGGQIPPDPNTDSGDPPLGL